MTTTVHTLTQQRIFCVCALSSTPDSRSNPSAISLSSAMLTCKAPPHAVPSEQPVRLTVDSVEVHAPVLFTYNQDPIINSIQPSRSFVRLDCSSFRKQLCRDGSDSSLCQCQPALFPSSLRSPALFLHLRVTGARKASQNICASSRIDQCLWVFTSGENEWEVMRG